MFSEQAIPSLTDKELGNLHSNALRLAQSGGEKQRLEAERLLPLIDGALVERRAARLALMQDKKRAASEKRAQAKAKAQRH